MPIDYDDILNIICDNYDDLVNEDVEIWDLCRFNVFASGLTSITLPSTLTQICAGAFSGCGFVGVYIDSSSLLSEFNSKFDENGSPLDVENDGEEDMYKSAVFTSCLFSSADKICISVGGDEAVKTKFDTIMNSAGFERFTNLDDGYITYTSPAPETNH